ncbi:uncharacterized protein STEHIDRAFT_156585 [Stereum hirsutum FP-91666 SS1]|uniref:uncharacterized protein n=1 Tax=Stereum hirsutum (strain FP-91666) TaxID=721885 RepID=UPI000440C29A|nr:uncharacterized protein STEHIDRAFT_156585 [Stereum hirsutum FP-91666 SS1]EIM87633.1 hypothetical protein STEHIDRAFT_156585 [Stereum hirsutum FP-91666 SS1]
MAAGEDPIFLALPLRIQSQIDRAFDKATGSAVSSHPPSSSSEPVTRLGDEDSAGGFVIETTVPAPGGFLLDDTDDAPGGYLPPSPPAGTTTQMVSRSEPNRTETKATHIPLSLIPTALQILDLPPADDDILSVFRNAASGWAEPDGSTARRPAGTTADEEEVVNRKDWRSVCAVLLEGAGDDVEETEGQTEEDADEDEMDVDVDGRPEAFESSGDASSDEYVEPGTSSRTRQGKRKRTAPKAASSKNTSTTRRTRSRKQPSHSGDSDEDYDDSRPLTARQQRDCLLAFAMFFPDIDLDKEGEEEKLKKKRMGVRELKAVAELLREKIKAEEMIEMLEAFSSSPDKKLNLTDFERMMIATRMA